MGVNQLLAKLLDSHAVGRCIDLRDYEHGVSRLQYSSNEEPPLKRPRRGPPQKLRLAIDVSCWVYKACQGFGDILADERYLDSYGRFKLLQEQEKREREQQQSSDNDANPAQSSNTRKIPKEQLHTFTTKCIQYVISRLKQLQVVADVLVVFDGQTPPIKDKTVKQRMHRRKETLRQRDAPVETNNSSNEDENNENNTAAVKKRLQAFRRAGAGNYHAHVLDCLLLELRSEQIPFLVSPYESDGQLAYLSERHLIDLVVTEDSDLPACGALGVLYKLLETQPKYNTLEHPSSRQMPVAPVATAGGNNKSAHFNQDSLFRGMLIRPQDWASVRQTMNLLDFNGALLSVMCVTAGCDYCDSLSGIGIGTANEIVRTAFFPSETGGPHPLRRLFTLIFERAREKHLLTKDFKRDYKQNFLAALLMYRHPVVYDPLRGECLVRNLDQPDVEFLDYEPYARLLQSYSSSSNASEELNAGQPALRERTLTDIVGTVPPSPLACYAAEGWLSLKTKRPRGAGEGETPLVLPEYVQRFLSETYQDAAPPEHATPNDAETERRDTSQDPSSSSISSRLETQPGSPGAASSQRQSLSQPSTISSLTQSLMSHPSSSTSQPSQLSQEPQQQQQTPVSPNASRRGEDATQETEPSFLATQPDGDVEALMRPTGATPQSTLRSQVEEAPAETPESSFLETQPRPADATLLVPCTPPPSVPPRNCPSTPPEAQDEEDEEFLESPQFLETQQPPQLLTDSIR